LETLINSPGGKISWHLTFEPAFDLEGSIIGVTYSAIDIMQNLREEKMVLDQEESLRQIDLILSANLNQPMELIKSAMASIKEQGYPDQVMEFELLEKTCNQLFEKGSLIMSNK
jgi:hypothetical protein